MAYNYVVGRNRTTYDLDAVCYLSWCDEGAYARHLCRRHYMRWYRNPDLYDTPPRLEMVNKSCGWCRKKAVSKGLCQSHYDKTVYRKKKRGLVEFDRVREIREEYGVGA